MKKVLFIFCILFSFSTIFAEDISTLEIEGISIGDNTLDFINEEELLKWVERTKDHYSYLLEPNKYAEVYYYKDLKIYDFLSFMIENYSQSQFITKRSEKYTIKSISGSIDFSDNLKGCLNKRSEIEKDIDNLFSKAEKNIKLITHPIDPSGKSVIHRVTYKLLNGDQVRVECIDFEENFRKQYGYTEGLNLAIVPKSLIDWGNNYKRNN